MIFYFCFFLTLTSPSSQSLAELHTALTRDAPEHGALVLRALVRSMAHFMLTDMQEDDKPLAMLALCARDWVMSAPASLLSAYQPVVHNLLEVLMMLASEDGPAGYNTETLQVV